MQDGSGWYQVKRENGLYYKKDGTYYYNGVKVTSMHANENGLTYTCYLENGRGVVITKLELVVAKKRNIYETI